MAFPRHPKIEAIYDELDDPRYGDVQLAERLAKEAMEPIETTLQAQSALALAYVFQGKTEEAFKEAQGSVDRARAAGDPIGEAAALNTNARVYYFQETPDLDKAIETANAALKIFQGLGADGTLGQADVARTLVEAYVSVEKSAEARKTAQDFVDGFRSGGDRRGTGACLCVLSEAYCQTGQNEEGVKPAKEAIQIFKEIDDKPSQAWACKKLIEADVMKVGGEAVWAGEQRRQLFKEIGDVAMEKEALIQTAHAHVAQVGLKLATCNIPSTEDTMGGLRASKDAFALSTSLGDREGMDTSISFFQRILMYNEVPPRVWENLADPEELYQDVLSGKYSNARNSLPPAPQIKQPKVEEIIPTAKQLDRGKFQWQYPNAGYSYTLIWQSVKERNVTNKKPRAAYDLLTLNTGTKSISLAQAFTAMNNDAVEKNSKSLVIYMTSQDHNSAYATNIISQQSTLACMITARLSQLTFVQFGEGHFDWTDVRARQVNMYPVTVALARSCRIEAPTVNIGFVGGDAASWMADPLPLIENLFDTLESDECEVMYRRGEAYGPLIVHRPMEEGVTYVKAKKGLNVFYK